MQSRYWRRRHGKCAHISACCIISRFEFRALRNSTVCDSPDQWRLVDYRVTTWISDVSNSLSTTRLPSDTTVAVAAAAAAVVLAVYRLNSINWISFLSANLSPVSDTLWLPLCSLAGFRSNWLEKPLPEVAPTNLAQSTRQATITD